MPKKRVFLIGNPVKHSLSPAMHNAGFKYLGLDYEYSLKETKEEDLEAVINSLRDNGVAGANVTIPYKQKVMQYLDDITDEAKKIGAVNTIVNKDGKLLGDNTDGKGFIRSLKTRAEIKDKTVYVCGAGGAARAIVASLIQEGAKDIYIYDVVKEKAEALAKPGSNAHANAKVDSKNIDILVNTAPCGMEEGDETMPVSEGFLHQNMFVYDIVYNRETRLIKTAKKIGIKTASGIEMLLFQGVIGFELWTNKKAPVDVMREALIDAMK
ncbi:MAG: shikimate dehydrogenase [Elusimicrobiota bacterium]